MSYPFVVYDISYPSPVTLKEMAANKIVVELWRQEIRNHRIKGTLEQIDFEKSISSSIFQPYVPSLLLPTIDEKIILVGKSIKRWVISYTKRQIFQSHVLSNFDDFVYDFDGSIDYGKTAKRMLLCDEISQIAKFKIACLGCFENDIELIWTSVSSKFNLRDVYFVKDPLLFYWICRLKNQLYKIPVSADLNHDENLDEIMFSSLSTHSRDHWPSLEYFIDRINSSARQNLTKIILSWLPRRFYRYVLPKFNEVQIEEFLTAKRRSLPYYLFYDKSLVFWTYLKDKITVQDFCNTIYGFLLYPVNYEILYGIWINSPDHFKQLAIQRVLLSQFVLRQLYQRESPISNYDEKFFFMALSDASFHNRGRFWNENWIQLLLKMDASKLRQLMFICFEKEDEIIRYKETVMSDYERIRRYCLSLFEVLKLEKLNEVLDFCFVGEQNIRSIRMQLLNEDFNIFRPCLENANIFDKFIYDTFDDVDRATEFKIRLLSRPRFVENFESFINDGLLNLVKEFIETLVPSRQAAKDFKKNILLPALKICLNNGGYLDKREDVDYRSFLRWCLENDDEIAEFKQTLPVDGIVHVVIRREMRRIQENNPTRDHSDRDPMTYHPKLVEFLKWYFVTFQAYENFVARYASDDEFVQLTTQTE